MLTKFETKSNRVKGLSFHPTRPWILASLHVGVIQLWDYRMGTLLDRFDEHDGPVRGIDFHKSQPLFVSGGDDYKIKVWNYKLRRCLFTLLDHMDYVRTVQFHDENPWILSASDDQTVKIWNWMSRTCIATLTGHNHYVMCAAFHPKEDLVMSASLDQTVRVWDISGLRMKSSAGGSSMSRNMNMQTNDLFGDSNASVKWQLEGHDRGVNWCSFHPSLPLFVSGADDKHVKLWRHNDSKAWEVDTFRGHFNNVSCVLFHPRQDMMISNSEDKSIRVWDIQKRTCLMTFRRESDRFWILAAHPRMNLFAAGHDNGMIVFKLQRERPGMVIYGDQLYYVKDRYIRLHEPLTGRDVPIMPIRRSNTTAPPRSLSYNPAENAVLITWDGREAGVTAGTYELYTFPKDSRADPDNCKRGLGLSAIFVARNRFAVLDNAQKLILIKNLENEVTKRCPVPHATTDGMFYAGTGMLLLRADDRVALYNVQRRAVLAELATPRVKYVYWSEDMSLVALLCKHAIIICNKKLEALCTIHETIRLKSGQWDGDVFIYTTLNHVKYCLPSGDSGTIRTLELPIYLTFVKGDTVYALDRQIKTRILKIDPTEYRFKLALAKRKYDVVRAIIKSNRLVGKSIVAYLQAKGFPDVALHLVKDELTRFSLAVECGDIGVAHEAAKVLDTAECWHRLGVEALRQGNHTVVEMAYQRTKNFARLSFLYLITGNTTNLGKMLTIAGMRKDIMSRFHNALYLGDMTALVNVLLAAGQTQLAYIAAVAYGLADTDELRDTLAAALQREGMEPPADLDLAGAQLLLPPTPILRPEEESWPLLTRSRGYFEGAVLDDDAMAAGSDSEGAGWGSDSDIGLDSDDGFGAGGGGGGDGSDDEGSEGDGWGSDDSMDLGDLPDPGTAIDTSVGGAESGGLFVPPAPGPPLFGVWADNSTLVVDAVAAGAFESAMGSLSRQIGAVNFEPMRDMFVAVYSAARASLPMGEQTVLLPLNRNHEDAGLRNGLPAVPTSLNALLENLQTAYKATKEGKFKKAREEFTTILMSIPFVRVESNAENSEALDLVAVAREYLIGLMLLAAQKEAKDAEDPKRQIELGAYFSHCNLQPAHLKLALDGAMKTAYKFKNLGTAAVMAKRLLDLGPGAKFAGKARKVLGASTENGKPKDNAIEIDYDEKNPFVVCCKTLVPIYRGSPMSRCGYCMAAYQPDFKGELCTVCNVAAIGAETSGLVLRA